MDLAPSPDELALAEKARDAFAAGHPAPLTTGPLTHLVAVARELGRASVASRFHTDVLLGLLGWDAGIDDHGAVATATGEHRGARAEVVPGGRDADVLVVPDGPGTVVEVDLHHPSVTVTDRPALHDPTTCEVRYGAAAVRRTRPLATEPALARAAVVLAADAAGAAAAALDAALDHVRRREQFGAPLGTLQVVQHRAADMAIDVRLATDAVLDAAGVADRGAPAEAVVLAAAHAKVAVARSRQVTASAHQLAGGQGILAAAPFHRWHRRALAAEVLLGDLRHHRAVVGRAALAGRHHFP